MILSRVCLGDGEKQETCDGHPRPDDGCDVLPTWRTLAREDLIRLKHGGASDWSLLLHPVQRDVPSKTQSYDDTIHLKESNLSLDHHSGCSPGGRPSLREDLRVPIRRLHQGVSKSNTCTGAEVHCSAPVPPFWGVTVHSGTPPHHGGCQKTEKVEVRQQHCPVRKIWKTGADPVRSQQKSTNLLRSHRLSSRGKIFGRHRVEDVLRPCLMVAASS